MPTLKIRNLNDTHMIIDRYRLALLPDLAAEGPYGWTWPDFAAWLFCRTNAVAADDLADYIEEFKACYEAYNGQNLTFSDLVHRDADATMKGVQSYERQAHELKWTIHELSGTGHGSSILYHVARAATAQSAYEYIARLTIEEMHEVDAVFKRIDAVGIDPVLGIGYRPGANTDTDLFMATDIERLGETLADESLWRDDQDFGWPTEVYALVDCARDWVKRTSELLAEKQRAAVPV